MISEDDFLYLLDWAASECTRRDSGAASVPLMFRAWAWVWPDRVELWKASQPRLAEILKLGHLVDPNNSRDLWREPRRQSQRTIAPRMKDLVDSWASSASDDWHRRFEEIPPFERGNLRVGSILWNAHRGSLAPSELARSPDFPWSGVSR